MGGDATEFPRAVAWCLTIHRSAGTACVPCAASAELYEIRCAREAHCTPPPRRAGEVPRPARPSPFAPQAIPGMLIFDGTRDAAKHNHNLVASPFRRLLSHLAARLLHANHSTFSFTRMIGGELISFSLCSSLSQSHRASSAPRHSLHFRCWRPHRVH